MGGLATVENHLLKVQLTSPLAQFVTFFLILKTAKIIGSIKIIHY